MIKPSDVAWTTLSVMDGCTGGDSLAPMLFWRCGFVIVSGVHGTDPEEN
ncbi:hypothetical protein [Micromonospora sp. WMMC250]|nr:hypothetical protein [Micromonospora sp. WMMC250]MCZ7376792.1 hypothetical protein [Micromonospora sp. WMMC250]